jgi:hypothetical protein
VYVAELARRLGERGLKVDVFTRRDTPDLPDIVDVHEAHPSHSAEGGSGGTCLQGSIAVADRGVLRTDLRPDLTIMI